MGLRDIFIGMLNGPRGQRQPSSTGNSGSSGGMSPIMMALLALLAYKALKGSGGQAATPGSTGRTNSFPSGGTVNAGGGLGDVLGGLLGGGRPIGMPGGAAVGGRPGGSLADTIRSGLGGLFGGAAAGSVLSSGLDTLIKEFQQSGYGRAAQSWVGTGPNQQIAPNDLANALGNDTIDALSQQTGMRREELLAALSQHLPDLIDQLTPKGRLPTNEESSRRV
jgi:uncharacterized protein YidB (DUF937 family)